VEELYRVVATVGLREADDSKSAVDSELQGAVLVSVFESSSVVACSGDLVSVSQPGGSVVSQAPIHLNAGGFALDVPSTLYPNATEPPGLGMDVLLDENGNGQCDDGEPHGVAALGREAESNVHVELVRAPCTFRL
jgi:hypothetical protein